MEQGREVRGALHWKEGELWEHPSSASASWAQSVVGLLSSERGGWEWLGPCSQHQQLSSVFVDTAT